MDSWSTSRCIWAGQIIPRWNASPQHARQLGVEPTLNFEMLREQEHAQPSPTAGVSVPASQSVMI